MPRSAVIRDGSFAQRLLGFGLVTLMSGEGAEAEVVEIGR
jgi:hypothetical protein